MYYKLCKPYILRGWDGLPFCLSNPKKLIPRLLSREEFMVLLCCDGMTDFSEDSDESIKKIIRNMLEEGIILSYKDKSSIEDFQRFKKHPNGYIHSVIWSITGDCNLKCKHCYMSGGRNKYTDISKTQIFDIISQFEEAGVIEVELSGGEPQLSPYLWDIVDELLRRNISISHFHTNAMLLNNNFFEEMKKRDLMWTFDSSLDGVGTHDYLRGTFGSEEIAIASFRKIREKGYPLLVNSKFHADSIHTALNTYELMKDIGVTTWKASFIFPIGEAISEISTSPIVNSDEYIKILKKYKADGNPFELKIIEGAVNGYPDGKFTFWENQKNDPFNQQRLSCGLCRNRPYILPDGTLVPCIGWVSTYIEPLLPKLTETSLSKIYANSDSYFRKLVGIRISDIIEQNEECRECEHKLTCGGGCRADALASNLGIDAIYKRGHMMCNIYRSGFMERIKELCKN